MIDPELTPEAIKAADVNARPVDTESLEVEKKISQALKGHQFKLQLSHQHVQLLTRFGAVLGFSWQEFLKREIESKILTAEGHIGAPLITGPSFAKGSKISGALNK